MAPNSGRKSKAAPTKKAKSSVQTLSATSAPKKSLSALRAATKSTTGDNLLAASTNETYRGCVRRGRAWLEEWRVSLLNTENPGGCPTEAAELTETDSWNDPEFFNAFSDAPNQFSSEALELFITFKCIEQGRELSTAEGIHAAFKDLWEHHPSNVYRGAYKFDHNGKFLGGNPASSPRVQDLMQALKHKFGADGGNRTHSVAMTVRYMEKIHDYISTLFPHPTPTPQSGAQETLESKAKRTTYLCFMAFASTSWTLWTRGNEALQLKWKHFRFGLTTEDALAVPYWTVVLKDHKGWQRHLTDTRETRPEANVYEIHPQPELPAVDMDFHMLRWLDHLRSEVYGRKELNPDDYIFPALTSLGRAHPADHLSHDMAQSWLVEISRLAGISLGVGQFTTHCFRRGGAQYRFMLPPVGRRWPLSIIRWWGGWAQHERKNTLIRYLLDELYFYEESCSDALRPTRREPDVSLLSEHQDIQSITRADLQEALLSIKRSVRDDVKVTVRDTIMPFVVTQAPAIFTSTVLPTPPTQRRGEHPIHRTQPTSASNSTFISYSANGNGQIKRVSVISQLPANTFPVGLIIPKVSSVVPIGERWTWWVKDWEEKDETRGHLTALKDWDEEWLFGTKVRGTYQKQWKERKILAEEFIGVCKRDEAAFKKKWPQWKKGPVALLKAIKASQPVRRRNSKNGTAKERQMEIRDMDSDSN